MASPSPHLISVTHVKALALASVLGPLLGGCSAPPRRPPLEMQPIGTVANVPRPQDEPSTPGATTTPNSATPPSVRDAACSGGDFDALDEALKACGAPMPKSGALPGGMKDKLEVRVTTSTAQTSPGGRVDVTVVLRNKSNDALPLYFTGDPTPRFDVEALDAKGRRADLPPGKQPAWPKGTGPKTREVKAAKITLEKGGTARLKISWDAVKMKWAPDKAKEWDGRGFPRVASGPLPAGRYTLVVKLPLVSEVDVPKVPIEVGG
jgi:hypothetical protein